MKTVKQKTLLLELTRGVQPYIRPFIGSDNMKLDVLPYLMEMLMPHFRAVNLHLYTQQEKDLLAQVVDIMIDYNLNYVQERTQDGTYLYNLGDSSILLFNCTLTN